MIFDVGIDEGLATRIVEKWGVQPQINVAIEECAELIKELVLLKRSFEDDDPSIVKDGTSSRFDEKIISLSGEIKSFLKTVRKEGIAKDGVIKSFLHGLDVSTKSGSDVFDAVKHTSEEVADVLITVSQIVHVFGMASEVNRSMEEKMKRLMMKLSK